MKLLFENWRKYLNEGVPTKSHPWGSGYEPYTPGTLAYEASENKKPILDITGKGSNELGDPHEPGSIAWKITNNLVTPCTSSADCAEKKKDDPGVDQPWEPTEDWPEEEYGQWYQENEEAVNKAEFDINQYLAVKKHGPNSQRWENFFDEQMEFVNSAVNQKQADDALRQVKMLLDRQEKLAAHIESTGTGLLGGDATEQWLWDNRWSPERD